MNIRRILSAFVVAALLGSTSIPSYADRADQNFQVFYDDFEDGAACWKGGSSEMRIIDGCLTTDAVRAFCSSQLQGVGTKKYGNFTMITDFTLTENTGWFGIYIRGGTDSQVHFVIGQNGFYTLPVSKLSPTNLSYKFEDGVKYTIRITADGKNVTADVKRASSADYEKSWSGEFESAEAGTFSFASYLCKAAVDSVKISEAVNSPVYYSKKTVKIPAGQSVMTAFENTSGMTPSSVSYTCTGDNFTVSSDGTVTASEESGSDYGSVTAKVNINGTSYEASYDVIRTYPVTALTGGDRYYEMTVGDTKNILVGITPSNASNNELIWETSNPEAVELVGDTVLSRGVKAIAPAKNVRITAKSKEDNSIVYNEYITVKGKNTEVKVQKFESDGVKKKIPAHMFGLTVNQEMSMMKSGSTKEKINEYVDSQMSNIREMKVQQFRKFFDGYDFENGKYYNGSDVGYYMEDVYRAANELGIPINITLDYYYDSVDKIMSLIKTIKTAVPNTEICLGVFEEAYDGRMKDYEPLTIAKASDYTDFLEELYPRVKAEYPDVKIGATVIGYDSDRVYSKSNSELLGKWNSTVLAHPDCYDAIVIHQYSGSTTNSTTAKTTKSVMEDFAIDSVAFKTGLNISNKQFINKEIWINEFGDLPMQLLWNDSSESRAARNQYMKSLGNAMSYMQRYFDWASIDNVTMAAYFLYNDSAGFGCVERPSNASSENDVQKLPSYYTLSVVGDVFDKNTHIYPLVTDTDDTDLFYKHTVNPGDDWKVDVSRINAWAFGDGSDMKEAVFVNNSEYEIKVYVPGYLMKKRMQYGDGENPVPELAVNTGDKYTDAAKYIPLPEYYDEDGETESYISMKPYSMLRADLIEDVNSQQVIPKSKAEIVPHLTEVFSDDFEDGLGLWNNENNWEIDGGKLKLTGSGWNTVLEPINNIASEALTVEYDVYGYSEDMYIQFYNVDNPKDRFYVRVMPAKGGMTSSEVIDLGGNYHKFGQQADTRDKWQTIKFELNDGYIYTYVKDSTEPEFVESLHKKGRPYSSEWQDEDGNNVSLLKKGVKYAVKIYDYIQKTSDHTILIDNFKIKAADTALNIESVDSAFTLKSLDIYVKTDSGYELSDRPVAGAVNKFIPHFEGNVNSDDYIIAAFYSGDELIDAAVAEYNDGVVECTSAESEKEATALKFMIWKNNGITPEMRAVEYILN